MCWMISLTLSLYEPFSANSVNLRYDSGELFYSDIPKY